MLYALLYQDRRLVDYADKELSIGPNASRVERLVRTGDPADKDTATSTGENHPQICQIQ